MARTLCILALCSTLAACGATSITPLVGEDKEVLQLLEAAPLDDPSSSALAAARRLHQALIQSDMELAWALLAPATRDALNALGKPIGMSGRELMDASSVPAAGGSLRKVNFATLLIGPRAIGLSEATTGGADVVSPDAATALIRVDCADGSSHTRTFNRDDTGWKLSLTTLAAPQ